MTETSHDIRTLNSLIATTIDSINGYSEAASDTESGRFGSIFSSRATERRQCATDLQAEVVRLGGNPEDDGTALAGAHRAFLNLKSAVTGKDDKAIVNEVERGEDHIKAKFEDALKDGQLTPQTRGAIERAYASVRQGHDQMRDLKHSLDTPA
ncbi:chemotaxis protein [Sphingomonas sp. DBB INV C78]|uniref:PA2169 family four-helix-bundle protein n=1 Tax=Sphingomonas sp. DBB INV C78 TaxID=3349434 RepID=UPI0036D341F1